MGDYSECPRCGNTESGGVYRCNDCGCISCKECDLPGSRCPSCKSDDYDLIGYIDSDEDDDD